MKEKCDKCGEIKEVYGYHNADEDSVDGYPLCKECYQSRYRD